MVRSGILMAALTLAAATSCKRSEPVEARPRVAVSIFPIYDLARRIAGDRFDVMLVLPPGRSEHGYDPTPKEIARLEGAELGIAVGAGLDAWVEKFLGGTRIVRIAELVPTLPIDRERDRGAPDPHVWLDPVRMRAAVDELAAGLAAIDPAGEDAIHQQRRRGQGVAPRARRGDRRACARRGRSARSSRSTARWPTTPRATACRSRRSSSRSPARSRRRPTSRDVLAAIERSQRRGAVHRAAARSRARRGDRAGSRHPARRARSRRRRRGPRLATRRCCGGTPTSSRRCSGEAIDPPRGSSAPARRRPGARARRRRRSLETRPDPSLPQVLEVDRVSIAIGGKPIVAGRQLLDPEGRVRVPVRPERRGQEHAPQGASWASCRSPRAGSRSAAEDVAAGRREIGYVPQRKGFDRDFPARAIDLIVAALRGRWPVAIRADERERARAVLAKLGGERLLDKPLAGLSGGETQRVFLARALITDAVAAHPRRAHRRRRRARPRRAPRAAWPTSRAPTSSPRSSSPTTSPRSRRPPSASSTSRPGACGAGACPASCSASRR